MKNPSKAQINIWKQKYGEIHQIFPDSQNPNIFAIVKHPTIDDITLSSEIGGDDDYKIGSSQLDSCWIDGDKIIISDTELHQSAAKKMGEIFRVWPHGVDYVKVTPEILAKLPAEHHDRATAAGEIREIIVTTPEKVYRAFCHKPALKDIEAADLAANVAYRGMTFLQETWISGDEELKSGSEEIKFSAYLASVAILKRYTAKVVKL